MTVSPVEMLDENVEDCSVVRGQLCHQFSEGFHTSVTVRYHCDVREREGGGGERKEWGADER